MIFGNSALLLLARLKLKAALRQQARRLRKPSGWIFALLGVTLVGAWVASLLVGRSFSGGVLQGGRHVITTQIGIAVIGTMTFFGALNHRGLYLPKEEIERLFAAPVSRADLVRYRLTNNLFRSLFAGLVFGLLSLGRLPNKAFGFVGILVTMLTLPLLGQAASLVFGDAENRLSRLVAGRWTRVLYGLSFVGLWLLVMAIVFWDRLFETGGVSQDLGELGTAPFADFGRLLEQPWLHTLLLPFRPWALMITADDSATFATWFALCAVMWLVLFELTARIPIDYRELSLETSADVARRLNRVRRGGFGAGVGKASRRTAGWSVPWLFGRGRFGAICWLKLGSILRKARGTVVVSTLIVGALTLVFTLVFPDRGAEHALGGAVAIAVLGTFYLCAGLRFDFRSDVDQIETIKAWPVRPSAVFLATLLPEVVLVSVVLGGAILLRAGFTHNFHPALIGVIAGLPVVILAWVALDNAVFLFAPVRYVPGQEGALHHMGRSVVLMLLRMLLLAVSTAMAVGPATVVWMVAKEFLELPAAVAWWSAGVTGWLVLVAVDGVLVWTGGRMFRRFDVARIMG